MGANGTTVTSHMVGRAVRRVVVSVQTLVVGSGEGCRVASEESQDASLMQEASGGSRAEERRARHVRPSGGGSTRVGVKVNVGILTPELPAGRGRDTGTDSIPIQSSIARRGEAGSRPGHTIWGNIG